MNYYYLAAILPTLSFGEPPELSIEQFRELCAEHLTAKDGKAVDALLSTVVTGSAHPFVREWQNREFQLRNAIAKARAARLSRDAGPYLREDVPYESTAERAVAEAFTKTTPLTREQALDGFRCEIIEEMAGFDPFTSHAILAYTLKFRLCNRWAAMNWQRGRDQADALINQKEQE